MSKRLLLLAIACAGMATPLAAGTISLAWDPVDHPDLAGYRIYYATAPDAFSDYMDVAAVTESTLSGLSECTTYYVAVKARDGAGGESPAFSNVVSGWARPEVGSVSPAEVERNSRIELSLDGANYQQGATVQFEDPAITVEQITWNGCHQLLVEISVGDDASLGSHDVKIVNPDQVFGVGSGLVSVIADGSAPVISSVDSGPVEATRATITWSTDEPADGQVFFRRQGETGYQQTAVEQAEVTDHEIVLQGLRPETTYEFHVRSADGSGNAAVSADQLFTTGPSDHTFLRFEAETGVLAAPLVAEGSQEAFAGEWLRLPDGTPAGTAGDPAGTAEYGFYVPHTATWRVWLLVRGSDASGHTWFEEVDGAGLAPVDPAEPELWQWVAGSAYSLDEGLHLLRLGGERAESLADRVLITDDPDFLPTEAPGDDAEPPDPVSELAATAADGAIHLSWADPFDDDEQLLLVIRYRTDGVDPRSPVDGLPLVETPVTPGSLGEFDHLDLTNGTTYSYGLFVIDESGNASDPALVQATPQPDPPGNVENLHRTDTE